MGYIAVVTNCSLVALSPSVKEYARGYSDVQFTLFFVAAEVCTFSDIQGIFLWLFLPVFDFCFLSTSQELG